MYTPFNLSTIAKWLGPGAINPLAIDGKGRGDEHAKVRQWVEARGRNVAQPGICIFLCCITATSKWLVQS